MTYMVWWYVMQPLCDVQNDLYGVMVCNATLIYYLNVYPDLLVEDLFIA